MEIRNSTPLAEEIGMTTYLYRFGYCTPEQWAGNQQHGWDDESSGAVNVVAANEQAAVSWGRSIADAFVGWLFAQKPCGPPFPGWAKAEFADWIEEEPDKYFSLDQLRSLPVVEVGEYPDFKSLLGE